MKTAIFLNGKADIRIGGRCGYVANLFSGIRKAGLGNDFVLIENVPASAFSERVGFFLSRFIPGSARRKKFRREWNLRRLGARHVVLGALSPEAKRALRGMGGGMSSATASSNLNSCTNSAQKPAARSK